MVEFADADRQLVAGFIAYLRNRVGQLNEAQADSVEVAIQCLESSFEVSATDYSNSRPLRDIFAANLSIPQPKTQPSDSEKESAECLKNEGNELMKSDKFGEALQKYNQALALYESPIYFCNRAAAYSKLERHNDSVSDCKRALALDPNYSKAYGRMGLAYSGLNQHAEAIDCYKKALVLDPENQSFRNNLSIAESKLAEQQTQSAQGNPFGAGLFPPGAGLPDLSGLLNNPAMMNIASQMMSDPNMQNVMNSLMSGMSGTADAAGAGPGGLQNLLMAGQQIAAQMQQQNPQLVEQLRNQFQGMANGANPQRQQPPGGDGDKKPDGSPPGPPNL